MSTTTTPRVPQGNVPAIGVPDTQDYPRLLITSPYFETIAAAEIIQPAAIESIEGLLPTLLPPYVQDAANAAVQQQAVLLVGSTMTGPLYLNPVLPTQSAQAASKSYVDMMISTAGVPEVPSVPIGQSWARQTGQWVALPQASGLYLPLTGGNMQGQINMSGNGILNLPGIPSLPNGAAPAQWVLNQIAAKTLYQGTWNADTNVPDLTQPAYHQNGYSFIVTTTNPSGVVVSQPIPGLQGLTVHAGDNVIWSGAAGLFQIVPAGGITKAQADALYLPFTGGQMSGPLTLNANATAAMQATTLQQVQALVGTGGIPEAPTDGQTYGRVGASGGSWHLVLPLAGGTLVGALTLVGNATANLNAVPLQQLNSSLANYVPLAGGVTMTGPLTMGTAGVLLLNGNASQPLQAVPFQQLTATLASYMTLNGVVSATPPGGPQAGQIWYNLNDGQTYLWTGTVWAVAVNPPVPDLSHYAQLAGATFTGPVVLPAGSTVAGYAPLAGATFTGAISVAGGISSTDTITGSGSAGVAATIFQSTTGTQASIRDQSGGYVQFAYTTTPAGFIPILNFSETGGALHPLCTVANYQYPSFASGGGPIAIVCNAYDTSNNLYGTYADAASDARIKSNFAATEVDALAALLAMPVEQFDINPDAARVFRSTGLDEAAREALDLGDLHVPIGFVAQHIQPFVPEAVYVLQHPNPPDGHPLPTNMHNVVPQNIVPYLVRAVQQLATRVMALETNGAVA